VNDQTIQGNGDRGNSSRSPARPSDDSAMQAAAETIHKIAAIVRGLKSANSAIENLVIAAAGRSDLTLAHWLILVYQARGEPRRQSEVNLETGMTAGYMTRLLDELDTKGLIRRHRSTEDRRQILLSLTEAGREATLSLLAAIDQRRLPGALDGLKTSLDSFLAN
jgi:DNA-binding MarR family transcriptional regulator